MFKQIGISKKIAAGVVAGLMLSSFLPVQAYSGEDAKRHQKLKFIGGCWRMTVPKRFCK